MAWLAVNGRVVAEAEIASDAGARTKGLLGRDGMKEQDGMDEKGNATDSVLVLEPAGWIHTLGMRFAIDVAYVDRRGAGAFGQDDEALAGGDAEVAIAAGSGSCGGLLCQMEFE